MKLMSLLGCLLLLSAIGVQANESGNGTADAISATASKDAFDDIFKAKPSVPLENLLAYPRAAARNASPRPECSRYHDPASCEATNWCVWDGTECIDGIPPAAESAQ